jgi:acyl-CoA hydrolase
VVATIVNAALEVDFLGQCASESLGSEYWSSSGGQPDFARGAILSEHGQSFIVLHSTTADESISRIVAQLHPGGHHVQEHSGLCRHRVRRSRAVRQHHQVANP